MHNDLLIETEQEEDGRWIADVPALPGAMVYGRTRAEAIELVRALAARILAEHGDGDTTVAPIA
jgi:predicted RNase H-like HicB family nuclease